MADNLRVKEEAYCRECSQNGAGLTVIRTVNGIYNERLRQILSGNNKDFSPLDIGCPHKCLIDCGLPILPIQVSVKTLTTKAVQSNHPYKLSDLAHLPEYVCRPIAVFRSATSMDDTKVILTEMEANGVNIIVIIRPNQIYKGYAVNDIRSMYPKDNIKPILEWICVINLLEYCDKQKILDWLSKHQYNPDEVTKLIKDCTKIIQEIDNE